MGMTGRKAHVARLKRISGPTMEREVGKALFAAGEMIQVEAQLSITSGSVSGKSHVPSQPGEPPNQDTGVLANNIETTQKEPLLVEVSSNAPYSAALELGSSRKAGKTARPGRKMFGPVLVEFGDSETAARPFMQPARDKMRPEVEKLIIRAVKRVVGRR